MNYLILLGCLGFSLWAIRRDIASRHGLSAAIWIPTLWIAIISTRPLSLWLGASGTNTLEGSPLDRLAFLLMIVAAILVLFRRVPAWGPLLVRNWPILLFYGYLLVTVLWANSTSVSFKRWFKEVGNIVIVLVILTEPQPLQAVRAVFVRCAYVFFPLSVVFVRYFPGLGRTYSRHSGELEVTGVTMQKNTLGTLILACGLFLFWDWLERTRPEAFRLPKIDRYIAGIMLATGLYLLYLSDSKTSMLALGSAALVIAATRLPLLRRRLASLGLYSLLLGVSLVALDSMFGISSAIVTSLGRDMTFTGRTDVWRELLALPIDPIFGTGFLSLWDDPVLQARLPDWVAFSAHNGYLEMYLAGGQIGVGILALVLLVTALRLHHSLAVAGEYAAVRFAMFAAVLIANFAESNFACMTPVGILFLLAAIGQVHPELSSQRLSTTEAGMTPFTKYATVPAATKWRED